MVGDTEQNSGGIPRREPVATTPWRRDWTRLRTVFDAAVDLPTRERDAWLAQVCAGDTALRREVESLLAWDTASDKTDLSVERASANSVESPAAPPRAAAQELNSHLPAFSRWKLMREIGRGGMGIVYLAEKPDTGDPSITLRAAVKILRHYAGADVISSRFALERRILSRLEHPFIARFLEGGSLPDGAAYLEGDFLAYEGA